MIRDFARMTWPEVEAALALRLPALLPIGAIEQHGAHLPLTTDHDLACGVAREVAVRTGAFLLPGLAYGDAATAQSFPGTLSIRPDTLRALVVDIGLDLKRQGIPALITVNAHFGNRDPVAQAARLLGEAGMPVLMLDHPGLEELAEALCESTPAGPGFFHADEVETSMMLALRPDAVQMDKAAPEYPEFPPTFGMEPMQLREISKSGVFGDPRPSTSETGQAFLTGIADRALPLITAFMARHGLPEGPWPR
ncbi:creatininase family protein [Flavimaricola marinus]|uniref:Creatinine amidohydrolase n=1 Tax=Flavimaricola marinus TaxID=1819565 RepID=A0A238LBM9_9RHOB|nr:creatininase family protein [Flavimaricola marinus]SMY07137.1 Creatinine amidohydrolase [Flavimaricola marinus]